MNSSPQRHNTAVDEQAAYWAARLDGDVLEASERADLDAWLAQSPAHRAALAGYCQFSADLEEQLPKLVASGAVKMPSAAVQTKRRRWAFPQFAAIGLGAAAAVAIGVWALRPADQIEHVGAAVGKRSAHTLADGTRVELNAHTSLRFENGRNERRVQLAGGEAIFMVTKDRARPFIVETPAGSVRVTGTTFNVRTDAVTTAFEVTVVEGSVQVRPADASGRKSTGPILLEAGDQVSVRSGQVSQHKLSAGALEDTLAWRTGQIVFKDVPLREAVARFAQYHGRTISLAPEVAEERVGGQYSLDDLSGFANAMEQAFGIDAKYDENGALVLSQRK
jgi:transmembrane sensor